MAAAIDMSTPAVVENMLSTICLLSGGFELRNLSKLPHSHEL